MCSQTYPTLRSVQCLVATHHSPIPSLRGAWEWGFTHHALLTTIYHMQLVQQAVEHNSSNLDSILLVLRIRYGPLVTNDHHCHWVIFHCVFSPILAISRSPVLVSCLPYQSCWGDILQLYLRWNHQQRWKNYLPFMHIVNHYNLLVLSCSSVIPRVSAQVFLLQNARGAAQKTHWAGSFTNSKTSNC